MADSCKYCSAHSLKNFTRALSQGFCVLAKAKVVQAIFVRLNTQEYIAELFYCYFSTVSKLAVSLNGRQMFYLINLYEIFMKKFGLATFFI